MPGGYLKPKTNDFYNTFCSCTTNFRLKISLQETITQEVYNLK